MKSICVFCGSSMGVRPAYRQAAMELGRLLLDRKMKLVYGGANVGLMKILAETVLNGGGEVIGVMPRMLIAREVAHLNLTKMYTVESMSERKNLMVELSDAFVALPGGFGTLDELAEVITYNQLRLTDKPVGLMNVEGYFDHLLQYFDHITEEGFLRHEHRQNLIVENNTEALISSMEQFKPVAMEKWLKDIKDESK